MAKQYNCKCGAKFSKRRELIEHVGLLNPHWPRTSPDDLHSDKAANHPSIGKAEGPPLTGARR